MSFAGKGAEADDPSMKNLRVGRDGWLYGWHRALADREAGLSTYHWTQTDVIVSNLDSRDAWLRARDIQHILAVVPDKATIYPEFLPPNVSFASPSHISQLRALLGNRAYWLEVAEPLRAAKAEKPVYFKTDSHWNYDGALIAANLIVTRIGQLPLSDEEIVATETSQIWDLGRYLDPAVQESGVTYSPRDPKSFRQIFGNKGMGKARLQIFETDNLELPSCVLFRDSYSSYFINYLLQRFSRVVAVASREFHAEIVESEDPDFVITQIAERYMNAIREDAKAEPFASVFGIDAAFVKQQTSNPPRQRKRRKIQPAKGGSWLSKLLRLWKC